MKLGVLIILALLVVQSPVAAGDSMRTHETPGLGDYDLPFYPNGTYRADVRSPGDVLGFTLGARAAAPTEILAYYEYLAGEFPNVALFDYALSYEGRRLVYLIITSEANFARLDDIRADLAKLFDPRGVSAAQANDIIKRTPAVAWLAYGIHGDELSSGDAALQLAYQLVAGTDTETERLRNELIIAIDPAENPDGRARWLGQMQSWNSVVPSADVQSLHHRGVWPWGRTNHYLFDLNRDWFALVHPESRGRTKAILEWTPQYVLDCHEMGPTNTYMFSPPRPPFNPYMTEYIHKWWKRVAAEHGAAFDQYGWSYYTREWNEEFFPGYGSSWSIYIGAIGMLFEQAGVDGSRVRRPEGTTMTYRESVHHQFIASIANLIAVAEGREELLRDFHQQKARNVRGAGAEAFLFPPTENRSRLARFAETLTHQKIEVEQATSSFKLGRARSSHGKDVRGKTFPEGTLIVRLNQPLRQLIEVILEFDIRIETSFLSQEKKQILKHHSSKLYEVTAWSMPLAYDLEAYRTSSLPRVKTEPYLAPEFAGGLTGEDSPIGFAFDCTDDRAYHLLCDLLSRGYQVWCAKKPFTAAGRVMARGSFLLRHSGNPDLDTDALRELAREHGVDVIGLNTQLGHPYADAGGEEFTLLEAPRIAIVGGYPVSPYSFGAVWHLLDSRLNQRVSTLELARLAGSGTDLNKYNVLVLPHTFGAPSGYKKQLGKDGINKLKTWVKAGGTLVAMGNGAAALADTANAVSAVRLRHQSLRKLADYDDAFATAAYAEAPPVDSLNLWEAKANGKPSDKKEKSDYDAAFEVRKRADANARRLFPRGAILRADLDREHWLTAGCSENIPVLFNSDEAYLVKEGVDVPGRLAPAHNLRIAGLLWSEARERWSNTAYLTRESSGNGQVILFAAQPNFRGYNHGSERLLLNALLLGPGLGTRRSLPW